jgi:hypothetical protein
MDLRKNLPLVIGLALPVILIIVVALTIYIPGQLVKPQHDFLYLVGGDYYTQRQYAVENGKLIKRELPPDLEREKYLPFERVRSTDVRFYRHDVETNQSQPLAFEEAAQLKLDPSLKSPDGFTIEHGRGGGIFDIFGGGSSYDTFYLRNKQASVALNLEIDSNRYFEWPNNFLGWIIPQ